MPSDGLLFVMSDIEQQTEEEFGEWYETVQMPRLLGLPGFRTGRRYRAVGGTKPKYVHLYDVEGVDVLEAPEYLSVRPGNTTSTPTAQRMNASMVDMTRGVYHALWSLGDGSDTDWQGTTLLVLGAKTGQGYDAADVERLACDAQAEAVRDVEGVLRARSFVLIPTASRMQGDLPTYLTLFDLHSPEVAHDDTWQWREAATPWPTGQSADVEIHMTKLFQCIYSRENQEA